MASPAVDRAATTNAVSEAVAIEWATATDVGRVRDLNEDTVLAEALEPGAPNPWQISGLLLVADGMGGHRAGEVASAMVGDLAYQVFLSDQAAGLSDEDVQGEAWHRHVAESVQYINRVVYRHGTAAESSGADDSGRGGQTPAPARLPGTTLTLCLVRPSEYCIAHVGDSRAYLVGAPVSPRIRQLTDDDSLVAEAVRRGELTAEQARNSPFRNHITKAIGTEPEIEPAVRSGPWSEGEVLLLCSDGLTEYVTADEMLEFVHNTGSLQAACRALVAIANHRGGQDNISVVAARHDGIAADSEAAPDEIASDVVAEPHSEPLHANGSVPSPSEDPAAPATEFDADPEQPAAPERPVAPIEAAANSGATDVPGSAAPAAAVAAPLQDALAAVDAETPEAFPEFILPHTTAVTPAELVTTAEDTTATSHHPSTMSTTKSSSPKAPAPRTSAPRPAASNSPGSRPPAGAAPVSRSAAGKPPASRAQASRTPASRAPAPRSSGAGQSAMKVEGNGHSLQRQRAIFIGSIVIAVAAVSMVLGVRSARHERANQATAGTNQAVLPVPTTVANAATATPPSGNATAPAIVDGGGAATVPLSIWLDDERKAIVVASKGHTIKAESGSNGNPVEADANRPTRTLVSFKHWGAAAKQLASGDAELVCRDPSQVSTAANPDTPGPAYRSEKDDAGHVKLNVTEASPGTRYVLEFRRKGDKAGQELAQFSIQSAAAATAAHGETTGGESGASNSSAATSSAATANNATDAGGGNNVQR